MTVNFGFRCITCGKLLTDYSEDGSSETITSHLAENPSHIIGEQYYDNNQGVIKLQVMKVDEDISLQTYKDVILFPYLGNEMGTIKNIYVISKILNSNFVYNLRIFDITNNKIIVEKTNLNNEDIDNIDLGVLSNLPTSSAILSLQVKTNSEYAIAKINTISIKY